MMDDRVAAAKLYDLLEEMLFIGLHALQATPRREDNRKQFIAFVVQDLHGEDGEDKG